MDTQISQDNYEPESLLVQRPMTKGGYITVGQGGEYETLAEVFEKLPDQNYYPFFLLPGEQRIDGSVDPRKKRCITITGSGASTSMVKIHGDLSLTADEIILRDICVEMQEKNNTIQLTGKRINTEGCAFRRLMEENNHIWSKNFQGTSLESGYAIAVDSENNVLITGYFTGEVDFGGGPLKAVGAQDLFIAKFNKEGEHIWSKNFQGTSREYGQAIAVDSENNVLITGYFTGEVDFGGGSLKAVGGQDLFIAKFNQEGEHIWSKNFQGASYELGKAIAVDSGNNVLITGYFQGEVNFGGGTLKAVGGYDLFIAKFNKEGKHILSKNFQGTSREYGHAIAVDSKNNILITGYFGGEVDFGGGPLTALGGQDLFIAKFDQEGDHIWSKNFQGTSSEYGQAIAVDSENNVLITGFFGGEVNFGGCTLEAVGGYDLFIAKFDQEGEHIWSKNSQGTSSEYGQAIAVDSENNVLITGFFGGEVDFGGGPLKALGGQDLFIAKFNQKGDHIWSNNFQGTSSESGQAIAVDSDNNVLITGFFGGEVNFGGDTLRAVGGRDLFIAKFNNMDQISPLIVVTPFYEEDIREDISMTLWSRNFQGISYELGKAIAVDSKNNVLITGYFTGEVDFGGGPLKAVGGHDLFIAKFNQEGEHIWSKNFQGTSREYGEAIAIDSENNVLITGYFQGEVNFGGIPLKAVGGYDLFIAKFNAQGEHIWSKNFQGTSYELGKAIAVDSGNNVLITGYFQGELDFGGGPLKAAGGYDLFIAKFNQEGEHIWSKNFQGTSYEYGEAIAIDSKNNVLITGRFTGELDFGGGPLKAVGGYDLFIAKFNQEGEHIWSRNFQGTSYESGYAIAVDSENNVMITGYFRGEVNFGGGPLKAMGDEDLFIAKFDQEGEHIWSKNFQGTSREYGQAIAVDSENNVLITGRFTGDVNFGGGPLTAVGQDLFIAKFNQEGEHVWSKNFQGTSSESGYAIALDSEDNILITGYFYGEIDFGDGPLKAVRQDIFIAKLRRMPIMTKKPIVTEFHWNDNENQNHWVISNPSGKGAFILGPFEALALVTNQINGVIRDSKINGLLTLMHELPDRGSINKIPEKAPELCLGKSLHLSNNEIFQLISKVDLEAGKYDAFESIIATNNVFKHKENFLICGLLTMNGNQFPGARQEADVVATVVGQSGTFVSNQAINPSAKIRRMLEHKQDAANLLEFKDQQAS